MPTYGGMSPSPERYGGGVPRLQRIYEALNAARGTALDTSSSSSVVAVENMAMARVLDAAWEANERLGNQWDPFRMTDTLPRWERIMGLVRYPTDTEVVRRARVAAVFARVGLIPTHQTIIDALTAALGSVFVALHTTALADAVIWWPGGSTNPDAPWYSTVAHLYIETQKTAGMTEADFYAAVGLIAPILDPFVPAWVTWDWYRNGPSGLGFYLDDDHNLSNEAFD